MERTILDRWSITAEDLTGLVDSNRSLRGIMLGYVAEHKMRQVFLNDPRIIAARKDDDHDRKKKGDLVVSYRGLEFLIELKSLQTNSIRKVGDLLTGKAQCDASDRRPVTFPNGKRLETTCLRVGEFDLLAVNLFAFEDRWVFSYALNRDLPRSTFANYTKYQRSHLLASLVPVTWPPQPPFYADPFKLLDSLVSERTGA